MTIRQIIEQADHEVVRVDCAASVRDAVALMAEHRIGALPVLDGERVAGIFSERDLLYCVASHGDAVLDWPVREVMTSPAVTVTRDTRALAALSLMTERRIRHLPVVDPGEPLGFISIGDIVKYRLDRMQNEAEEMRAYIRSA